MIAAPAVFLDRDGTINVDIGYLSNPADLVLLPGVVAAIRAFNRAGWLVVVISNQSGIGRGYFDETVLAAVHARLIDGLAAGGARIDAIYYCPHHPAAGCNCRKPATGLIERARQERGIDLSRSWVIGDKLSDIELGRRAGCRTALVLAGAKGGASPSICPADLLVRDLAEAAAGILGQVVDQIG